MTVGAAVGWAILSVVTLIVATKTLGIWGCGRSVEDTRQSLGRSGNDPMSCGHLLGIDVTEQGVFLGEICFWDESGCGRQWPRGNLRSESDRG